MVNIDKDVLSINELDTLNSLLADLNEFLVACEDNPNLVLTTVVVNVEDTRGVHLGALTKYSESEDIKFEPGFKAEL